MNQIEVNIKISFQNDTGVISTTEEKYSLPSPLTQAQQSGVIELKQPPEPPSIGLEIAGGPGKEKLPEPKDLIEAEDIAKPI